MQYLTGLGLVSSGLLRILAVYVLLAVCGRLTSRFRTRYALWLLFLIGAGIYWVILLIQVLKPGPFVGVATQSLVAGVVATGNSETTKITIPFAWDYHVELASGVLVWTYAVGLILMLLRLARRRRSLRRAVAKARSVDSGLQSAFEAGVQHLGVSRCRILGLLGLSSPGVVYTWRPVILVPEDLGSYLDSEQLIDVLYHELIHVRRLDFLWGTVADFVGCLLFFHPAVWLALRSLGRERELACDGAVMELRSGRRTDYASSLVRLARRRVLGCQLDPSSHLALLNSFLAFRVQILLTENHRRSRGGQVSAVTGGVVALLVFFAGWSSLSLAIGLAAPPTVSARPAVPGRRSSASQRRVPPRGKEQQSSAESTLPVSNPNPPSPMLSDPELISSVPVSDDENYDASIPLSEPESVRSLPDRHERPMWDEATPANTPTSPSWRRTALNAAIDALGRVVRGRGRDSDDDDDDKY